MIPAGLKENEPFIKVSQTFIHISIQRITSDIVELFEQDSLMTGNNSEVAPEH